MVFASLCLRRRFLPGILAIAGLLFAGCFNGLGTLKCTDGTHCPTGYSCVGATATTPGLCQIVAVGDGGGPAIPDGAPGTDVLHGVDLVSSLDVPALPVDGPAQVIDTLAAVELGSVVDVGALPDIVPDSWAFPDLGPDLVPDLAPDLPITTPDTSLDLGLDVGLNPRPDVGPDLGPDLPALKGQGAPCSSGSDCQDTLVCADGVCCNQACAGCNACSTALNGQKDGTCLPVLAGHSAHNACTAAEPPCGLDGTCDGAGSCRYPARGTACGSNCSGSTLTPKFCDGAGTCAAGTVQSCSGSLICADATSCKSVCASNTDCVTGNCTANGTCGARKLGNGATCSTGAECANGICSNNVCCNVSCTGACEQCTAATNGICTNTSGTVCSPATDCMAAAVCSDSSGTCPSPVPKSATTLCGASPTCNGNTQAASFCDGAGNCGQRTNKACGLYACLSGTGCKTACTTNADCVSDSSTFCGPSGTCTTDSACWRDITTNLLWQLDADPNYHYPADAQTLCSSLSLCGFSDWYVPDIDQLRTLISGCPANQTGGACGVTDSCLLDSCGANCIACDYMGSTVGTGGCYQTPVLTGPCGLYWSSSSYTSNKYGYPSTRYRSVDFGGGVVNGGDPTDKSYVRCIR